MPSISSVENTTKQGKYFQPEVSDRVAEYQASTDSYPIDRYQSVESPCGTIEYGKIPVLPGCGGNRYVGVQQGYHDPVSGKGFGLRHIETRHGRQLVQAGFADVRVYIAQVLANYDEIWRQDDERLKVVWKKEQKKFIVVIERWHDEANCGYVVITAFINSDIKCTRRDSKIWERNNRISSGQAIAPASVVAS